VLLLAVAYLGRGYIRTTVVPAYAQTFYMPGVDKKFDENLTDATRKLESYGVKYNTNYDECWSGGDAAFENFRETVPCIKYLEGSPVNVSNDLQKHWKAEMPQLEQRLLTSGWQKQYNANESIADLLTRKYDASVSYHKNIGKIYCEFSITYSFRDPQNTQSRIWSKASCQRDVGFFGGYY
jgi:hypothetical protein